MLEAQIFIKNHFKTDKMGRGGGVVSQMRGSLPSLGGEGFENITAINASR